MVKGGNYTIENIYQGGYSTLDPNKAYSNTFTGYRSDVGSLGLATDFRTANIIQDASTKLSTGAKQIEISTIQQEIFDSVPKQHLTEMRQLGKLIGVDISLHAPLTEPSGISQQGGYSELNRELAERKITDALLRSHELNPNGNIPVTFHSSNEIAGSEWKTLGSPEKAREANRLIAVDREDGKMIPLEFERKYYPGGDLSKPTEYTPEENLRIANSTRWSDSLTQVEFNRESAERIMQNIHQIHFDLYNKHTESQLTGKPFDHKFSSEEYEQIKRIYSANEYLNEAERKAKANFSKAYESAKRDEDEATIHKLKEISQGYAKMLGTEEGKRTLNSFDPKIRSESLFNLTQNLEAIKPRLFVPIEEFAVEQSSKTFGNAAFNAFDKFKDANKTPMLVIENPPAGAGLSTGEDLRNLVVESRKQFVKKAVEEKNMGEREAEKIAEKLIGATWDVGHINMLRKSGFKDEDIIRETEKIAPYVKHVHLSDNFGYEHTELPMGMGNVPIKEIMERLGEKGFEGKKIIEAGNWWQHFKTAPFKETLEGFGAQMYSVGGGPYWNQSLGLQQGYFSGYGMMLPSNNYQTFGAGFSQLPGELGGELQKGSSGGRFSQRGME